MLSYNFWPLQVFLLVTYGQLIGAISFAWKHSILNYINDREELLVLEAVQTNTVKIIQVVLEEDSKIKDKTSQCKIIQEWWIWVQIKCMGVNKWTVITNMELLISDHPKMSKDHIFTHFNYKINRFSFLNKIYFYK